LSAAIEKSQFVDQSQHYPMPWCFECETAEEMSARDGRRQRGWRNDDEVGMMERWLREFSDVRGGTSSPPPMS